MLSRHTRSLLVVTFVVAVIHCTGIDAKGSIWPAPSMRIQSGDEIYVTRTMGAQWSGLAGGGEYAVFVKDGVDSKFGNLFSFCLESEADIHLTLDPMNPICYTVTGVSNSSVGPGGGILDQRTKYLFEQYATSNLDSVSNFVYGDMEWIEAMQLAIWNLQGQPLPSPYRFGLPLPSKAIELLALADSNQDDYLGGVFALNLVDENDNNIQDLLWYQTKGPRTNSVPEPTTLGLWFSLGAAGFVSVRLRKYRLKKRAS